MKNILGLLLLLVLAFGTTSSFAEDNEDSEDQNVEVQTTQMNEIHKEEMKREIPKPVLFKKENREDMKQFRDEHKGDLKEKREMMKDEFESFREDNQAEMRNSLSELSEEKKDALKNLQESFQSEKQALEDEYKNMMQDETTRAEFDAKMKELMDAHHDNMMEELGDDTEAKNALEKRKELMDAQIEKKKELNEARKEFRGQVGEKVLKYKTSFVKRLGTQLDKISDTKIELVLTKVNAVITKVEGSKKYSDAQKDKYLSQVIALKEILEETLESRVVVEDELDIDAFFE